LKNVIINEVVLFDMNLAIRKMYALIRLQILEHQETTQGTTDNFDNYKGERC